MSGLLSRLSILLFGLFVVGGLVFGIQELSADRLNDFCGDDLGELGTCPPFTEESCEDECFEQFGSPDAGCLRTNVDGDCCTCLL